MSRTIVVTGGSRGIGAATVRLAAARGWSVGFSYLSNDKAAEETIAAVEAAGGKALAVKGDVAKEEDVVRLFDATAEAFGPIAGVVNNAGVVIGPPGPLADMSTERLMMVIAINILGAMLVAREGVRRMATDRGGAGGSIVNVSSVGGAARRRQRICRLRRQQGRARYADHRAGQGMRAAGRARQCGAAGADRHRDPRQRRPARPRRTAGCVDAARPGGAGRGGRRGDRVAAFGRRLLRQRSAVRRDRRSLAVGRAILSPTDFVQCCRPRRATGRSSLPVDDQNR